jgi:hypothetical protein
VFFGVLLGCSRGSNEEGGQLSVSPVYLEEFYVLLGLKGCSPVCEWGDLFP